MSGNSLLEEVIMSDKDNTFLGKQMKNLRESHKCSMDEMLLKLKDKGFLLENKSSLSRVEAGRAKEKTIIEYAEKYCQVFGLNEEQTKQFLRGNVIAIPDTSALLKRTHLIEELNHEYSRVIIPKIVVDELDYIKNKGRNSSICKKAWEILRGISYGDRTILKDYSGESNINNDCKIIGIAHAVVDEYCSKVEIITEDTDYSAYLKGDETVSAVHLKEYVIKKQTLVNMDRMDMLDSLWLDSYEENEKPTKLEANAYLRDGLTLIISALRNKEKTVEQRKNKIRWLIQCGADVDERDNSQRFMPALSHAIQMKNYDLFSFLLLECRANPNVGTLPPFYSGYIRQKNYGNMPLMIAANHGLVDFVKLLLEDERISINQQDGNGFTALIKSCRNGFVACRDCLINAGADEKIVDLRGRTALDHYHECLEKGPAYKRNKRR